MLYRESQLDKRNKKWFENDTSHNLLKKLSVSNGQIRGVFPMSISFEYPITAIVGENGAGKSTILALVACAFHNNTDFCPQNRVRSGVKKQRNYYTYGDFFTFTPHENGIQGIEIKAEYLKQDGLCSDTRRKKPSGKWNDYNRRPPRAVSYLGLNRIVPPSESYTHKHYSRNFSAAKVLEPQQLEQIKSALTKVFGKNYTELNLLAYNTYRLFGTSRGRLKYTGFNMGAGENAVLSLFVEILMAGSGALIVVDEIESGLHAQAKKQLIEVLKEWCDRYKCQIICSTHSKSILDAIPPEGRIFVKQTEGQTTIIPKISSEFAFEKLSGETGLELDVFVEDKVGQAFLENLLPQGLRERINIMSIGSDQAVLKHIAVHYREKKYNFIAFLDGDKRTKTTEELRQIKNHLESRLDHTTEEFNEIIEKRLCYLPGEAWPEQILVESAMKADNLDYLMSQWGVESVEDIHAYLEQSLTAERHDEFYSLSTNLHLPIEQIQIDIIRFYKQNYREETENIVSKIHSFLR